MKKTSAIHAEVTADALQAAMTSFLLTVMEFLLTGMEERDPKCKQGKEGRFYWNLRLWYEFANAGEATRNNVVAMTIEHEVPADMVTTIRGDWGRVRGYFGDNTRYSLLNPAILSFGVLANCMRVFAKKAEHGQTFCFSFGQTGGSFVQVNDVMGKASKEKNGFDRRSLAAVFSTMPSADTLALAILFGAGEFDSRVMDLAARSFDEQPCSGASALKQLGLGADLHSGLFQAGGDEDLIHGEPTRTGHPAPGATSGRDVVAEELPGFAG